YCVYYVLMFDVFFFFFQAEDGIRDRNVTGVQTCALPIPGGPVVKRLVAIVGLLVSIMAFVVSFFPPSGLPGGESNESYVLLLSGSFIVIFLLPFVIYAVHSKHGKETGMEMVPVKTHNTHSDHFFIHPRARSWFHLRPKSGVNANTPQAAPTQASAAVEAPITSK